MAFERGAELSEYGRAKRKANYWRAIVAQNSQQVFKFFFGCWHRNLSRPFTLSGRTYEVCLSCGKEFAYVRVDFGRSLPKGKKKRSDWTSKMQSAQMAIDVGIWTGLSTNARDTNRPLLIQSQPDSL
jgi:hypothetical protein